MGVRAIHVAGGKGRKGDRNVDIPAERVRKEIALNLCHNDDLQKYTFFVCADAAQTALSKWVDPIGK
jgi:hypothetical protein